MVVFTLVLLGCPRKWLFLHWFYKVVREKCCFYIGFTRVVREKPCKALSKSSFFVDNPPGMVSPHGLTTDSQWTHNGLTKDSQWTHTRFTPKSLFLHWFYKVVREKGCFYIGFTRLSAKNDVFTLVLQGCPRNMLFLHWF